MRSRRRVLAASAYEAAQELGVNYFTLLRFLKRHPHLARRQGRQWQFTREDIERLRGLKR